ncbi:hypothetical protein CHS0354_041596 [Potamilus streckersoni]|uniref:Uncharacterized protein n=1 Tax=Potamilus streckersoni TaxID=2493646 RepID=A0AAE0VUV8_9BIVA|nr:hypothetical protein CHS0354_041596 [Potamilus streckersoni]
MTGNLIMSGQRVLDRETTYPPIAYKPIVANFKINKSDDIVSDIISLINGGNITGLPTHRHPIGKSDAISYDQLKGSMTNLLHMGGVIYNIHLHKAPLSKDNFVRQLCDKSGDTTTSTLDMGVNKIISTGFPTTSNLTNKNYVDNVITGYTAI